MGFGELSTPTVVIMCLIVSVLGYRIAKGVFIFVIFSEKATTTLLIKHGEEWYVGDGSSVKSMSSRLEETL
jgi:hypothetical protein